MHELIHIHEKDDGTFVVELPDTDRPFAKSLVGVGLMLSEALDDLSIQLKEWEN